MTFRLVYISFVLAKGVNRDVQPFFHLGEISYRAKVGGPQKAVHAESCFDFLLFVPKFRCFLKKKKGLHQFSFKNFLPFSQNRFEANACHRFKVRQFGGANLCASQFVGESIWRENR